MKKFYFFIFLFLCFNYANSQSISSVQINNIPSCPGNLDGDVTVNLNQTNPVSHVEMYLYRENPNFPGLFVQIGFSDGSNNQFFFSGLDATNYRVDLRDSSNANNPQPTGLLLDQETFTISDPIQISSSISINDVSCNGFSDGSLDLNVSGGAGNYTYQWTGPNGYTSISEDISLLSEGTYNVTITDGNGCQASNFAPVVSPGPLTTTGYISQSIVGNGNFNGQITAQADGGTLPYQYSLDGILYQSSPVFDNLGAGTYDIYYRDSNLCQAIQTIILTEPIGVSGSISVDSNVSCYGYCDGQLSFNTFSGTSPFEWSINGLPFQNNSVFNNLCGDSTYSITVRDADSSVFTSVIYLNQPTPLTFETQVLNINNYGVNCNWDCNGEISINNPVGGAGSPITYSLDSGQTFSNNWSQVNLCPGLYHVAVQDANGCIYYDNASITAPDSLIASVQSSNVLCFGDQNGELTINNVSGGFAPYTLVFNGSTSTGDSASYIGLDTGTYIYSIIDANGCEIGDTITIIEPSPFSVTYSTVQNTFVGFSNGSVTPSYNGGTSPYSYSWTSSFGGSGSGTTIADGLLSGSYNFTFFDANGCSVIETIELIEPDTIYGCIDPVALNYNPNANFDNGLCYYCSISFHFITSFPTTPNACNGWISAPYYGSVTPPVTYTWSNGYSAINGYNLNQLCNDTFSVTIIDNNNCGADTTILLSNYVGCTDVTAFNFDPSALFDDGSCISVVLGCTDPTAFNYNSVANIDDGSCIQIVYGCTDSTALNYFAGANTDDSTCCYISGCTDPNALNYDYFACFDDGSCITVIAGCTDPGACNFDVTANYDDGTCLTDYGCTDLTAFNYDPLATCSDNSCIPFIYGCTDSTAFNYNPSANTDDTSCIAVVFGCTNSLAVNYDSLANVDDGSCYDCIFSFPNMLVQDPTSNCNGYVSIMIYSVDGGQLTYDWNTNYGLISPLFVNGNSWAYLCTGEHSVSIQDTNGCVFDTTFEIGNPIYGCLDISALNYNPFANVDDSTCCYIGGCTDPSALNYDSIACFDDGNCCYTGGCTDPMATNYNPNACFDDGNCCLPAVVDLTVGNWILEIDYACDGTIDSNNLPAPLLFNDSTWNQISTNSSTGQWEMCDSSFMMVVLTSLSNNGLGDYYIGTYNNGEINGFIYDALTNSAEACFTIYLDSASVILGCTDPLAFNYDVTAQVDDGNCDYLGCTNPLACNFDLIATIDDGSCLIDYGCTDSTAFNYDSLATCDNGSCIPVVFGCTDSTALNYDPLVNTNDGSCIPYLYGCTDPLACNFNPSANTDDGSCLIDYGCTDPNATNYDSLATCDDGSCIIPCNASAITGVFVDQIIHNRAVFNWDNMNTSNCQVDQIVFRYREVGTSSWTQKFLGNPVGSIIYYGTSKRVINLTPSTTYEYQFKIWYVGVSSPVNWGANPSGTFTTLDECPNVGNFAVSTPLTTRATFTWDDSNGAYSFVRIQLKNDTITTPGGWQSVGGFGVNYGTWTRNKNGLTPGETYRAKSRTWCDPSGGAYKAPLWTGFIYWTQPTSIRLEGESVIANLDVYPNPSRDIFNVSFTSEEAQDLDVRVVNVVGEAVYTENLEEFIGEYTKQIDLANYTKGVYFLEIKTSDGVVNKKLILQ